MRSIKKTLIAAALVSAGMAPAAESNQPVYWPAMAMMPVQFGNQVVMIPVSGWITPRGFLPAFAPAAGQPPVAATLPTQNFFPTAPMPPVPGMHYPAVPGGLAVRPAVPYPAPLPGQVPMPSPVPLPQPGVMAGAGPFGPGMFAPGMNAPAATAPGVPMAAPMFAPMPPTAQRMPAPGAMPSLPSGRMPGTPGFPGGMAPPLAVAPPGLGMPGSALAAMPAPMAREPAVTADSAAAAEAPDVAPAEAKVPEAPALRTEAAMVSVPVGAARPATHDAPMALGAASAVDRDGDGVPNDMDLCPERAGAGSRVGCPADEGITLGGIVFRYDSDELTDESKQVLDRFAQKLMRIKGVRLEVAGHTDARGDAMYNLDLSERRARAVREYLVEQGVNPSRLVAKGYGQTKPLADNESREGRATNRRVELKPV
jgi:outer membrane protein OmpA-like peptidoglycan-associated protein